MALDCAPTFGQDLDAQLTDGARRLADAGLKRAFDIVGSSLLIVLLAPFLLLVAIAIRVESRGPALFRQRRTGLDGALFVICKFRTMTVLEDGNSITQVSRNDCRVTRIGALLRRTSIDELPNLLNVLVGQMSLIGPRPHALAHDRYWSAIIPEYQARWLAKPGITGLAQVAGWRGETPDIDSMANRVAHDLHYIRNWSLGLDIIIALRTLMLGPLDPAAF
jgi:lipopolysaccharide/colanic/teichoic acid biosynthesis glycosyltransferase